jgi:hypothetical protein
MDTKEFAAGVTKDKATREAWRVVIECRTGDPEAFDLLVRRIVTDDALLAEAVLKHGDPRTWPAMARRAR